MVVGVGVGVDAGPAALAADGTAVKPATRSNATAALNGEKLTLITGNPPARFRDPTDAL
jgi:hypothetical protein